MFDMPPADNKRIAALTLHGLCPSDRAWVLSQLSPAERETVQALIDELTSLGVPADPELLKSAVRGAGTEPRIDPMPVLDVLQPAPTLAQLGADMAREPDTVLSVCLGAYDEAEVAVLLAALPADRATRIRAQRRALPVDASALREAIRSIAMERARIAARTSSDRDIHV